MKKLLPTLGLTLAALSGCGSGATDIEDLSAEQVRQELIEALDGVHAFDLDFGGGPPWPCSGGGDVSFLLTYGYGDSPEAADIDGYLSFEECVTSSPEGHPFSLTGDLTTSLSYHVDALGQILGVDGTTTGDVSWQVSGQTGTCRLDLSVTSAADSVHVSGTACGGAVERTLP